MDKFFKYQENNIKIKEEILVQFQEVVKNIAIREKNNIKINGKGDNCYITWFRDDRTIQYDDLYKIFDINFVNTFKKF